MMSATTGPIPDGSSLRIPVTLATQPGLWAELLDRALGQEADLEVSELACDEVTLARILADGPGRIVLLDYEAMGPGCEGVIARMRRASPVARFLVLAWRSGEEIVVSVLRAGAAGLVAKHDSFASLMAAVRAVAAGETWAHRRITAQALDELSCRPPDRLAFHGNLTTREWQVADFVSRGLRNRDIAMTLGISDRTVKAHMNNIFLKLAIRSRMELALWAQGRLQPNL